ncbi:unnamed protein product [Pieris brassicae]|uniref:Uncharacterized protein n=1 Tax=Pieris brassicae TaxID=7116 RepID=A0A9P0TB86_PIEBR|nr:unnamed protein product [Pieris brassicae]
MSKCKSRVEGYKIHDPSVAMNAILSIALIRRAGGQWPPNANGMIRAERQRLAVLFVFQLESKYRYVDGSGDGLRRPGRLYRFYQLKPHFTNRTVMIKYIQVIISLLDMSLSINLVLV